MDEYVLISADKLFDITEPHGGLLRCPSQSTTLFTKSNTPVAVPSVVNPDGGMKVESVTLTFKEVAPSISDID